MKNETKLKIIAWVTRILKPTYEPINIQTKEVKIQQATDSTILFNREEEYIDIDVIKRAICIRIVNHLAKVKAVKFEELKLHSKRYRIKGTLEFIVRE